MRLRWSIVCALAAILAAGKAEAQHEPWGEEKTLSPYFHITSNDAEVDQMPLLSTSARVNIAGVIADVALTQVYANRGKRPIEAIYVFPASTRAAVYAMVMTIGDRCIRAQVRERDKARQEYVQAREAGKSASLLEQQRPNVFQMRVANIMPGDTIAVELKYTELLIPTEGVYEFVYPTVVGPRYSNLPARGAPESEQWVAGSYTHEGRPPTYEFDVEVALRAGMPIQCLDCPSHGTKVKYRGLSVAEVTLDGKEKKGGNRDFVLRYSLRGRQVHSGLLLYEGEEENFFLLIVEPPKRVRQTDIPPREFIFIMDVSGSMHGYPIDVSKRLMRDLLVGLRKQDRFNLLLFAGGSRLMACRSIPADRANINRALGVIENEAGGGGTEIVPALKRALAIPRSEGTSRSVVIATDGYVNVEPEAFRVVRSRLGDANMFAFGIGKGVNRHLIDGIAHIGRGECFVAPSPEGASEMADRFREYVQSPVLTGIEVDFGGLGVYDVEPVGVPDVLADRPVVVFGKWRGRPSGTVKVTGTTGNRRYEQVFGPGECRPRKENSALRYLWARERLRLLADYADLQARDRSTVQVTELGLRYNLMTKYTSFVAVDDVVRNKTGEAKTVKQPLPMPEGVTDYAVAQRLQGSVSPRTTRAASGSKGAGPASDAGYTVDGVAAQDHVYGTVWTKLAPTADALQSVVVVTGGFDATYGAARGNVPSSSAPVIGDIPSVSVAAKKVELVNPSTVSVERVVTEEEFKRLPVSQLSEVVGARAGVSTSQTATVRSVEVCCRAAPSARSRSADDGQARFNARARIDKLVVGKGVDQDSVRTFLLGWLAELQKAYERELHRNKDLEGRLKLSFTLSRSGQVTELAIEHSEVPTSIEMLLIDQLEDVAIPNGTGEDVKVEVTYKFEN